MKKEITSFILSIVFLLCLLTLGHPAKQVSAKSNDAEIGKETSPVPAPVHGPHILFLSE